MDNESNKTQLLRKKYSMICAEIWKSSSPGMREDAQNQLNRLFSQDSAVNWMADKLGYLPKFPVDKEGMEAELMDILTKFQVELDPEFLPTMEEAKANPQETLMAMADLLEGELDPLAGERD